ncbi:MAG: hypothetical protein ACRDBP_17360 [Luteolibacter sp.]
MAAIFLRTPLGLGKRKSAENIGIFSHRLLDLKGGSGVTRPFIGKSIGERWKVVTAGSRSERWKNRLLDVRDVLLAAGAGSGQMPDLDGSGKGAHSSACEIFHK